jgi:hypothetical protein
MLKVLNKNFFLKNQIQIIVGFFLTIIFLFSTLKLIFQNNCCDEIVFNFNHEFYFKPYLSVFIIKVLNFILNSELKIILSQLIFPILIYHMLFKIFSKYTNQVWASCFCLVSLISFENIFFRNFLLEFFSIKSFNETALTNEILRIQQFPLPSLSVLFFLVIFQYSNQLQKLTILRISKITFLWSLLFYINALDGIFGFIFWYSYVFIRLIYSKDYKRYFIALFFQLFITSTLLLPAFFYANLSGIHNIIKEVSFNIFEYQLIYMLLPLSLIIFVFLILKIDFRELIFKFLPIYCLMMSEFVIIYFAYFYNFGISLEILTKRVPTFFLHFLYYIPVLYFLINSKEKIINLSSSSLKRKIAKILIFTINKIDIYFLFFLFIFLFIFSFRVMVVGII